VPEVIIVFELAYGVAAWLHGLETDMVLADALAYDVQCKEQVTQAIKDTHEEHEIKRLVQCANVVNGQLPELDGGAGDLCCKSGLSQIGFVEINAQNAISAAPLHFDRIETSVTADIQHRLAGEIHRN